MKYLILVFCFILTGCASQIAAWKGRAYGEHSINGNTLVTMSGTFRTGRTSKPDPLNGNKVYLCLEPFPEVAALMGGTDKLMLPIIAPGTSVDTSATVTLSKGHESTSNYQAASLAYTIACNEWINGNLSKEDYAASVKAIVSNLTASIVTKAN